MGRLLTGRLPAAIALALLAWMAPMPVHAQQAGSGKQEEPAYFALPDSALNARSRMYDFTLLPYAIPCIALDDGLYLLGVNEWLLPPKSLPIRSVLYDASDSSLLLLSPRKKKTMLCKLSISTGQLSVLDSLDGVIYHVYPFSDKYLMLSGKEDNQYMLWLYNKQAGYMSELYSSKIPVTAAAIYHGDELLVASGGIVLRLGHDQKIKQAYPVGFDIDGLLAGSAGEIIISTRHGVMVLDQDKKARLLIDKQHGLLRQYNNSLYILDADNRQVIKKTL